jgi:hypothetical protein
MPYENYKSNEYNLASIGALVLAFQSLEFQLCGLLGSLLDRDDVKVGIIASSQLSFAKLIDALDAVFRYRCDDKHLVDDLSSILVKAAKFEEERNKFLHSYYYQFDFVGNTVQYKRIKRRTRRGKGYLPSFDEFDPEQLSALVFEVETWSTFVTSFAQELLLNSIIKQIWNDADFVGFHRAPVK